MNKPKSIIFYDLTEDIIPKLCEYIGVDDFRKNSLGDFWHVFLWLFDEQGAVKDGCYFTMRDDDYHETEENERGEVLYSGYKDKMVRDFGEWGLELHYALKRLHREYGNEITILTSW